MERLSLVEEEKEGLVFDVKQSEYYGVESLLSGVFSN